MYQINKINTGLVATLIAAAAALIFIFHTAPANRELAELKNTLAALQTEISALRGSAEGADGGNGALGSSEVERRELANAIPELLSQDTIIADLNRIAKSSDVSFNALSFSREPGDRPKVTISGGFRGTPGAITRFLKMIETNPRKLVIREAGLSRAISEGGLDIVNLNATITAFYRHD